MVDTISNTRGIGRGATRYGSSPAVSNTTERPVAPVASASNVDRDPDGDEDRPSQNSEHEQSGLRLEIDEHPADGELIYRFVDAKSGDVVRQWDGRELGRLRDYVLARHIHLIDKKV